MAQGPNIAQSADCPIRYDVGNGIIVSPTFRRIRSIEDEFDLGNFEASHFNVEAEVRQPLQFDC